MELKIRHEKSGGFTLAEVLITLGIIGVVAAMTLPTLIAQNKSKETVAKLKKFNSTMNQAFIMAVKDNGTPDSWGFSTSTPNDDPSDEELDNIKKSKDIVINTFKPYLKTISVCGYSEDCTKDTSKYYDRFSLDGSSNGLWGTPNLILADGTYIIGAWLYNSDCNEKRGTSKQLQNVCGEFFMDINGKTAPNATGKDVFLFYITKYGITPMGTESEYTTSNFNFDNSCNMTKAGKLNGYGCAAWVIYNENMDYLKCNDLSWEGKHKCN